MIKIEDFGIDPVMNIGTEWHALVEFHISGPDGWLHLFGLRANSDRIYLLVSSPGLTKKPEDAYISNELFSKRLVMESFDEQKIREYVQVKFDEATSNRASFTGALRTLDKYFEIDDHSEEAGL